MNASTSMTTGFFSLHSVHKWFIIYDYMKIRLIHQPIVTSHNILQSSLEARLSAYSRSDDVDPVPHSVAWKYIAYARKNITEITLSVEACQVSSWIYRRPIPFDICRCKNAPSVCEVQGSPPRIRHIRF